MGLHWNLWVKECEIHQNPSSIKRANGITGRYTPYFRLQLDSLENPVRR